MTHMYESLGDDIEIEFELDSNLPPCEVDPTLLETALLNIAINGRDAMPEGGVIRFQTASIVLDEAYHGEVAQLDPGTYVCLSVSDTGDGIPEEILPQVFDPFFTTKTEGEGTGLGLSMVYVKIYSEKGKGTTIRIYLPTTEKPLPEALVPDGKDASATGARGASVLLVDDDQEVRDIVLNALREIGCRVEAAENGDDAISLIRSGAEYDLIFTDMVMTGDAGGPDVARAARAVAPNIPVIFCSGYPRGALDGEEASIEGALFLSKPFHQDELVRILERALNRSASA